MANRVLIKRSATASSVPTSGDLDYGELALNYTDEKIYFKNASDSIVSIGASDLSSVSEHILPSADETYDLGSSSYKWRDLYLSGNTIKLGAATISAENDTVVLPDVSTINRNGTKQEIATVDRAGGRPVRRVPVYTQTSGESSAGTYINMAASSSNYVFTGFVFTDGSSPSNTGETVFFF